MSAGSDLRMENLQRQYEDLCQVMNKRESAWVEQRYELEQKLRDCELKNSRLSEQIKLWETKQSEWKDLERDWKSKEMKWMEKERSKENEWMKREMIKETEWNMQMTELYRQQDEHNVKENKWREDHESLLKEVTALKKRIILDSSARSVEDARRKKAELKAQASTVAPSRPEICSTPRSGNRKSLTDLKESRQRARCQSLAEHVISEIGDGTDDEKREILNRVIERASKAAGISFSSAIKMSIDETAQIRLRHFTGKGFVRFKRHLIELNPAYNNFAATGQVRKCIANVTSRCAFRSTPFTYTLRRQKRGRQPVEKEILKEYQKKMKIEKSRRKKVEDAELSDECSDDEDESTVQGVLCEMSGFQNEFTRLINDKAAAGTLNMDGHCKNPLTREKEVWLSVQVDTGDRVTKIGAGIANIDKGNSALNFQLGALWNGDDSRRNLETKGIRVISELNGMEHVKITTSEGEKVYPIRQFMGCDFKAAHALMGMDGAMGSHDCFYGYRKRGITFEQMLVSDPDLRFNAYNDSCEPRTLESFSVHAHTVNGERFNVSHCPLLERIPPQQVTPDPLHLIMGVSSNSDEELRCAFIRKDLESHGIVWPGGEKECNKLLKNDRAKIVDLAKQADDLKRSLTVRQLSDNEKPNFYATLNGIEREKTRLAMRCKEIQRALRLNGTHGQVLHARLSKHGLLGNFYNAKTGNQVSKMLSCDIINELWDGYITQENKIFVDIMHDLAELLYFAQARFLTTQEIEYARNLIADIMLKMGKSPHKHRKLTLKWHTLSRHVIEYMQRWKTWGLMSSQQIESVHPRCTKLFIQYSSVKDKQLRFELVGNAYHAEVVIHGKQKRVDENERDERKRKNNSDDQSTPTSRRSKTAQDE